MDIILIILLGCVIFTAQKAVFRHLFKRYRSSIETKKDCDTWTQRAKWISSFNRKEGLFNEMQAREYLMWASHMNEGLVKDELKVHLMQISNNPCCTLAYNDYCLFLGIVPNIAPVEY